MQFSHLHCHTQFSLLDGAADIKSCLKSQRRQHACGGPLRTTAICSAYLNLWPKEINNGIKPIVGCEFYVVEDRHIRQFTKDKKDVRHHQLLLAKDESGIKTSSKCVRLVHRRHVWQVSKN